ncbi:MAG: helix-hairpin-helix domain-containing protein [Mangrovibacterium sp.]
MSSELNQLQLLIEEMYSDEENQDLQQVVDELMPLFDRKIAINTASAAELEPLFFLSPLQQRALIAYREKYGDILSMYELPLIEGFDMNTVLLAALFFDFSPNNGLSKRIYNRHELLARSSSLVQQQAGFTGDKFAGDAHRLYLRYRGNVQRLEFGFTGEKDPGESFAKGFDYNSAFAQYTLKSDNSRIILGDYIVQWGQGLSLWQGFSVGKSSDATQIVRFNEGIKPYSSTDENNFMRGVAAQLRFGKHWELMPFYSYRSVDANLDTVDWRIRVTSLQSSGLHRTASEIADKRSLQTISTGAKLNFRAGSLKVGFAAHQTLLSLPLIPAEQLYNKYLFSGTRQQILSASYQYNFNRLFLFGETATDRQGIATLHGVQMQPTSVFSLSVQHRFISKNYNALYASAQTESSRVNDERGFYVGMKFSPLARLSLAAYADYFYFSWIKYTTISPVRGREFNVQAEYQLNNRWQLNARY